MTKKLRKVLLILASIIISYFIIFYLFGLNNVIMKKTYPKKYEEYVVKYAREYGIDELLVYSIIKSESNFKQDAISKSEAKGLMQLMEKTAIEMTNEVDENESYIEDNDFSNELYNPETNIKLGTYYFSTLIRKYNNVGLALAAYNAGMGRVDEWIKDGVIKKDGSDLENIPYNETNIYVRKILNNYTIYKKIY